MSRGPLPPKCCARCRDYIAPPEDAANCRADIGLCAVADREEVRETYVCEEFAERYYYE